MQEEKYLEIVKEQSGNLVSLLKTVLQKQKALISGNISLIEKTISTEEKLLLAINRVERLRVEFLNNYKVDREFESKDEYFFEMAGRLRSSDSVEFQELRKNIKGTTKVILQVNEQNKYLISQSRTMLNEIVTAVFSDRKVSLLDRKV
jgi:flagellar biosynthesis/type III secretory pathway chaperone